MPKHLGELHTDLKAISTRIAGVARNGVDAATQQLSQDILRERKKRLTKQNVLLAHEIERQEEAYGNVHEFKEQVRSMNETVKRALRGMAVQVSTPIAGMQDPGEIQQFLHTALNETFNLLARTQGRGDTTD